MRYAFADLIAPRSLCRLCIDSPQGSIADSTLNRCPEQVSRYCGEGGEVQQALAKYKKHIESSKVVELTV